jgi:hypothetical protein
LKLLELAFQNSIILETFWGVNILEDARHSSVFDLYRILFDYI